MSGATACEVLGEHLTAIPVVDERLELLGYVCGACGALAGRDRLFPPPGPLVPPGRSCRSCGAAITEGGFLVPLPDPGPLPVFPLVDACSAACVAALLAPEGPPGGEVVVKGEAAEAWRRWLADPANHYDGPPIPLEDEP